jgi:hypothetical protein
MLVSRWTGVETHASKRRPLGLERGRKSVMSARSDIEAVLLLSLSAFVVWLACGLTMAFGRSAFGLETALRIHAIAAPVFAALVSLVYFRRFHAVTPLVAAAFVTAFIVVLDAGLVAPVFEKSYAMFSSILGTWLPFLSIFVATYLTGSWIVGHSGQISAERT